MCLILIDANEGVTEQDTKVAGLAHEAGKACIIVVNKWDTVEKDTNTMDEKTAEIRRDLSYMTYAPVVFISALTGQRVDKLFDMIVAVSNQNSMRITTGMLNNILEDATARVQPPTDKGRRLKIYYITQVGVKPPHFVFFCNDSRLFHFFLPAVSRKPDPRGLWFDRYAHQDHNPAEGRQGRHVILKPGRSIALPGFLQIKNLRRELETMEQNYARYAVEKAVQLLAIDSPTGFTDKAAEWVQEAFTSLGFAAQKTEKGGILIDLGGKESRRAGCFCRRTWIHSARWSRRSRPMAACA